MGKLRAKSINFILIISIALFLYPLPAKAVPLDTEWNTTFYENMAELKLPAKDKVDNFFGFEAEVDQRYEAVLVKVIHQSSQDEVYYYFPAKDKKVQGKVYLRFGIGKYQVEFNLVKPNDKQTGVIVFEWLTTFKMENTRTKDMRFLLPSWGIESNDQIIVEKANKITQNIENDYQKVMAIYNWFGKNIRYDMEKYKRGEFYDIDGAVETLQSKKGLCRDFANLMSALCRAAGIEARTVIGKACSDGKWYGHAWNEVKVGEKWIAIDTLWKQFDEDPREFNKNHVKLWYNY